MPGEDHPAPGQAAHQVEDTEDIGIPVVGDKLEKGGTESQGGDHAHQRLNGSAQKRQGAVDPFQADDDQQNHDQKGLGLTEEVGCLDLDKIAGELAGNIEGQKEANEVRVEPAPPGEINQHGRVHELIGEGIDGLPLLRVKVTLAGNITIGDVGNHPEGEEQKTQLRVAHVQKSGGHKAHGITGPADGIGVEPGMRTHPGHLGRGSQKIGNGKALGTQHQQHRKSDFNENGSIYGHGVPIWMRVKNNRR